MDVRGRNLVEGIPQTITVNDQEVREALDPAVSAIVDAVRVASSAPHRNYQQISLTAALS